MEFSFVKNPANEMVETSFGLVGWPVGLRASEMVAAGDD